MTTLDTVTEQLQQLMPVGKIGSEQGELEAGSYSNPLQFPARPPLCILKPANPGELQQVIAFANEAELNLTVTSSSGVHRNGGTSNRNANLLIDLTSWQKIDLVDRRNRVCRISRE